MYGFYWSIGFIYLVIGCCLGYGAIMTDTSNIFQQIYQGIEILIAVIIIGIGSLQMTISSIGWRNEKYKK